MSVKDKTSKAERLGFWMGRCLKRYCQFCENCSSSLSELGVHRNVTRAIGWAIVAVAAFTILYVAFWVGLVFISLLVASSGLARVGDYPLQGWREGPEGYGYYQDGSRIDYGGLFDDDDSFH